MRGTKRKLFATILLLLLGLSACTPHKQYRTKLDLCTIQATSAVDCKLHTVQRYQHALAATGSLDQGTSIVQDYLLGFVEFDDQGMLYDRKQMDAVLNTVYDESVSKDLLIVVFMHGWKHSAEQNDDNVNTFRTLLGRISESERALSNGSNESPRQVVGVYLGWRGESVTVPLAESLSFWERKNTAEKIGQVGVTEFLSRLERIRQDKDSVVTGGSRTRLAIIGNGLGGTAVYTAVSQTMENQFIRTMAPEGAQGRVLGFGNLVVLINPALEAMRFTSLLDMAAGRTTYFGSQLPMLAVLTSETDYATKLLFSFGRRISTLFESEREISRHNATSRVKEVFDESSLNVTAVGHFSPYRTHYLYATEESPTNGQSDPVAGLQKVYSSWVLDYPGSQIGFKGSILERTDNSAGRNPYMVVQVSKELIKDHGDLSDERMQEFIKELILVSCQTPKMIDKSRSEVSSPPH